MIRYHIFITPAAWKEAKRLPGHVRQRVKRAIDNLAENPRPPKSKQLKTELEQELWRLRLDRWRIVYAITDGEQAVDILAIRKRPPYDYDDLNALLETML